MTLASLTKPWAPMSYGFLDASAKRELRRKMIKAVCVPGCQMPYASREVPMARGWGTGGLQVSLTLIHPQMRVKVIDQGADDSVNAASIRRFLARVSGAPALILPVVITSIAAATRPASQAKIPQIAPSRVRDINNNSSVNSATRTSRPASAKDPKPALPQPPCFHCEAGGLF